VYGVLAGVHSAHFAPTIAPVYTQYHECAKHSVCATHTKPITHITIQLKAHLLIILLVLGFALQLRLAGLLPLHHQVVVLGPVGAQLRDRSLGLHFSKIERRIIS
jgi:hypothetical protein